uniref:non-specific serine/threonine protein kinase n=1 Tax=Caligus clemensi TaxID=344056 RepID=C1C2F2_CALCM|nr:Serine/threonine-protein kinase 16 [Caligus clemensi]
MFNPHAMFSGFLDFLNACICSKRIIELNGRSYSVLDHLADGGFSRIDLVENQDTKQSFALKTIECHSKEDETVAFEEINHYKSIDHELIVPLKADAKIGEIKDINETSQVLLLFPYYPRGSLHDELTRRATSKDHLPSNLLLNIFHQICEGLSALHSLDPYPLAHRDIKPHNVLLTKDFAPVIIDLGSATKARVMVKTSYEAKDIEDTAAKRSSITYRSPELFHVNVNKELDERTDIWSLGCLLYALCYFKSPFDSVYGRGDSVALAVQSASNVNFPSDSPYPKELHELIEWMLTLDMSLRPYLPQIMKKVEELLKTDMI